MDENKVSSLSEQVETLTQHQKKLEVELEELEAAYQRKRRKVRNDGQHFLKEMKRVSFMWSQWTSNYFIKVQHRNSVITICTHASFSAFYVCELFQAVVAMVSMCPLLMPCRDCTYYVCTLSMMYCVACTTPEGVRHPRTSAVEYAAHY